MPSREIAFWATISLFEFQIVFADYCRNHFPYNQLQPPLKFYPDSSAPLLLALLCLFCPLLLVGQTSSQKGAKELFQDPTGAKAIFVDPTSGARVTTPPPSNRPKPPAAPTPTGTAGTRGAGGRETRVADAPVVNTGLMYYVELIKPSGEVLRVNSDRTFHSGERIRLHFTSNVEGKITLVQKRADGSSQILFPDPRINGGNNAIKANTDTVLPSDVAFFKFDAKPGQERLMVLLTSNEADTKKLTIADNQSGDKATQIAALVTQETGSKDLFIDLDNSASQAARYVVVQSTPESKLPPGVVAVEIVLNHQP